MAIMKPETTYDRLMRNPEFVRELKKEAEALHLSELFLVELSEKKQGEQDRRYQLV